MTEIIYKEESYAVVGACFEVYNEKGCGFLEAVYQECLGIDPKLEYERIAKTQQIRKKTEISDASF